LWYEWDDQKNQANLAKHGSAFEDVFAFRWDTALVVQDERMAYGETRWIAIGLLDNRLHILIYTIRQEGVRVISLRKANDRERRFHETQKSNT